MQPLKVEIHSSFRPHEWEDNVMGVVSIKHKRKWNQLNFKVIIFISRFFVIPFIIWTSHLCWNVFRTRPSSPSPILGLATTRLRVQSLPHWQGICCYVSTLAICVLRLSTAGSACLDPTVWYATSHQHVGSASHAHLEPINTTTSLLSDTH